MSARRRPVIALMCGAMWHGQRLLIRRSILPVRPVRRNPNPHVSVLPAVRHRRHSPVPSDQSVRKP
jgi:hypothetical protein